MMTGVERISRILKLQPVDRIGVAEQFWPETKTKWVHEGHMKEGEDPEIHFNLDLLRSWAFNLIADLDFKDEIVEQTDETRLVRNGNGALLRWHKLHSRTPEHVDFLVKERSAWEEHIKPKLLDEKAYTKRIKFEEYRKLKEHCKKNNVYFTWAGINVFECMHPVCGHEYMLMGMALDPDWVKDMCTVYADLTINLQEELFAKEGKPDGLWYFEDMGFKGRPFMSPEMYRDIIWPAHKKTFDYAHSKDLPVIVHSCGCVEKLVPGLIRAGMDCLQAMEVKAGMDVNKLKKLYGDKISFMGGMDVRALITNNKEEIKKELMSRLPVVMKGSGYVLHTDHSIPDQVEYDTYKYFVEEGLKQGTY